jgi:hypothetical protein
LCWTASASRGCLHLTALTDLEPQARFSWSCLGREHLQVLASPWHSSLPTKFTLLRLLQSTEICTSSHLLLHKVIHDTPTLPTLSSKHIFSHYHLLSFIETKSPGRGTTDSSRSLTFDMEQETVEQMPQEKKPNMSSLTRRACYKCGNVGHYAEMCSSTERLCYNCKQPGHESNGCPHPRTTESQRKPILLTLAIADTSQLSSAIIAKA